MAELVFDEVADATLDALEAQADHQSRALLDRVNAVLDQLAADPSQAAVRRRRFRIGLWLVTVPGRVGEDDWAVLWEPHVDAPADVMVHYVGPASFA